MPVNLGNWGWAASLAIDVGAPVLGAAFGIPGLAGEAGQLLKSALGLAPNVSEATIKAAVDANPDAAKAAFAQADAAAAAKWDYLKRVIEVAGDVAKTTTTEVNQTIRAEMGTVSWYHWRNLLGYVVGFEILAFPTAAVCAILFGTPEQANALISFQGTLVAVLSIAAGLLGFVAIDTTNRYNTAATGERAPGILATTVKAVVGVGKK